MSGHLQTSTLARVLIIVLVIFHDVSGHGRLIEPPSRASMWRLGYDTPPNYDDNQLFCGGVGIQYGQNNGKCGVCGDPWNGRREHEAGGIYANGIIVRKYEVGEPIKVKIELTANHKGYFEFHICPTDNPFQKITETCLRKHPMTVVTTGKVRYQVPEGEYYSQQTYELYLLPPKNLRCKACMLQWKYNAGNSWGTDKNGVSCIGCGDQEQFYGCADIAIGHDDVVLGKPAVKHPWYFQEETDIEWHIGVVHFKNGTKNSSPDLHARSGISYRLLACLLTYVVTVWTILTS
ncbi:uncharacterized protein LOC131935159 [Physella acuta]|uniref:uncharacterized protein LOC131935159 n=1 Tax=Physella acuta TaxID=109671 RepID=UPI0027DC4334|nr:uncharacterized protein LOC131935159 [Physella acuta]